MTTFFKENGKYFLAIFVFVIVSVLYFSPVLEGKKIYQNDIKHFIGMADEIQDFREENNQKEPYWTNSSFSGMPTYNLSAKYPNDYIKKLDDLIRFLPRPADYLFLYFLSFFILLVVMKVDYKLAILGALAFGFSTYFVIILGVGHNSKAHAIGYMPLVLSGILLTLRNKYVWGFLVTFLAMALEIKAGHPQMTYYLGLSVLILGSTHLISAYKSNTLKPFFTSIGILVVAVILAVGVNAGNLLATKEYASFSTRGKSALTIDPQGNVVEARNGLTNEYITEYSYGKMETFNLIIPRFMGGGNREDLGENSHIYNFLADKADPAQAIGFAENAPLYWGDQPIVEAPAYIGVICVFLALIGLFLVDKKIKYWLLGTFILSVLLSWGKNLNFLTELFIDYMPLYNKFRAVSSIQVLAELAVPILAVLGLNELLFKDHSNEDKENAVKKTFMYFAGFIVLVVGYGLMSFDFDSFRDASYAGFDGLVDAIKADRKTVFLNDGLKALVFVALSAGILWLFLKKKIKSDFAIIGLALLILIDLVPIAKRYVNNDDFLRASQIEKPFVASEADNQILQDKSHYRVGNFATDPMNDGSTSYFHNSIGGYHAAKMGRYQELFDFHIAKNNMEVLNMLNVKYFKFLNDQQVEMVQMNPDANGNAWFVENLQRVTHPNDEIMALDSINTKDIAVINVNEFKDVEKTTYTRDSLDYIQLITVSSNELEYEVSATTDQYAVFSEIYYENGWNAYLDGALVPHQQVNYILRGMSVPAGKHQILFKFEPTVIKTGSTITLASFGIALLLLGGLFLKRRQLS